MSDEAAWMNSNFTEDKSGKLVIFFHTVQKKLEHRSVVENRPVFEERVHITKIVPGDARLVIDRPIRETDKEEFAEQWAHWQLTKENKVLGIPIDHWHSITETQKAEFKALKIFTVEQFANLPDSAADRIMGFHGLRAKAKVFVEAGKDAELLGKIRAEADAKVAAMEAKMAELTALVENLQTRRTPKPRRPLLGSVRAAQAAKLNPAG